MGGRFGEKEKRSEKKKKKPMLETQSVGSPTLLLRKRVPRKKRGGGRT